MQHRNTARATLSAETHRWRFPVLAVTPGLTRAMLTYMSSGKHVQDVAFPRRRVLLERLGLRARPRGQAKRSG